MISGEQRIFEAHLVRESVWTRADFVRAMIDAYRVAGQFEASMRKVHMAATTSRAQAEALYERCRDSVERLGR